MPERFYERFREARAPSEPVKAFVPLRPPRKRKQRLKGALRGKAIKYGGPASSRTPRGTEAVQEVSAQLSSERHSLREAYMVPDPVDRGTQIHIAAYKAYQKGKRVCERHPEAQNACQDLEAKWDDFEQEKKRVFGRCRCVR